MLFLPITIAIITTLWLQATALPTKRESCDSPCVTILLNFNNHVPEPWVITLDGIPNDFTTWNATDVSKILVESAQDASVSNIACIASWSTAESDAVKHVAFDQQNPGLTPTHGVSLTTVACSSRTTKRAQQAEAYVDINLYIDGQAQYDELRSLPVDNTFNVLDIQHLNINLLVIVDAAGADARDVRCDTKWLDGVAWVEGKAFSLEEPGRPPRIGLGLVGVGCGLVTGD